MYDYIFVFCYKYLILMLEEFLEIVIYYVFELMVKFINYICKIYLLYKYCLNYGRYIDYRVEIQFVYGGFDLIFRVNLKLVIFIQFDFVYSRFFGFKFL